MSPIVKSILRFMPCLRVREEVMVILHVFVLFCYYYYYIIFMKVYYYYIIFMWVEMFDYCIGTIWLVFFF